MVSEKRFRKLQGYMADNNRKYDNGDVYAMDFTEVEDMLNELYEENKQLRTQLLICQQFKSDDGRFRVWQVPPIQKGIRITTFTASNGDEDEI